MSTPEAITLDSGVINFNPHKTQRKAVTVKFQQKSDARSLKRLFQVFDNQIIGVQEVLNKNKRKYLLNLSMLDETPKKVLHINFTCLYIALFFTASAILLHTLDNYGIALIPSQYEFTVYSLLDTASIVSIIWLIYHTRRTWVFKSCYGNIPMIEILNNNPNKEHYRKFVKTLEQLIMVAKHRLNAPEDRLLPAILGEHRRLRDEGIITEAQYETAKTNILGNHKKN